LTEPSDQQLLHRFAANRDEEAFRALYRAHTPMLYLLAMRLLNSTGAEDAVQETWMRAARSGARFAGRSSVRTWLIGILINCCRESTRQRTLEPVPDNITANGQARGETIDLERAVRALPDGYRHVLLLHDLYGYTHEEISELLGIETGTSKSQLARARERIREKLAISGDNP
jgi:RNA polymerase sigma factor (sigma-70 family)